MEKSSLFTSSQNISSTLSKNDVQDSLDFKNITIPNPNTITEIDFGTFKRFKNLVSIKISASVIKIGADAFMQCDKLCMYGYKNSYSEQYAKKYNLKFMSID